MFEIDDIVTLCGVAFGKNSHFSYDFRARLFEKSLKTLQRNLSECRNSKGSAKAE